MGGQTTGPGKLLCEFFCCFFNLEGRQDTIGLGKFTRLPSQFPPIITSTTSSTQNMSCYVCGSIIKGCAHTPWNCAACLPQAQADFFFFFLEGYNFSHWLKKSHTISDVMQCCLHNHSHKLKKRLLFQMWRSSLEIGLVFCFGKCCVFTTDSQMFPIISFFFKFTVLNWLP